MCSESITCPKCGKRSYSPSDCKHGYCGNCKQFHTDMDLSVKLEWWDGDKWVFANDCSSMNFAKVSLGLDNHNYRTVDTDGRVTWCTKEGEEV